MKGFDWSGKTVVVMASGPSLTAEDVETVRQWREVSDDRRVIVTNTTFKAAPWADVLYARDFAWWRVYRDEALQEFSGYRLTNLDGVHGAKAMHLALNPSNSGADSVFLAAQFGAKKIILLGCDAKYAPDGERHHHGDHPKGMGNCESVNDFYGQFKRASAYARCEVLNSSRDTSLDFWPRMRLDQALDGVDDNPLHHAYWLSNTGLDHLTPRGKRFPEVGLFDALREACQGSVFEVGCGDGRLSPAFDPDEYTGMDVNPAALIKARQDNPAHRYTTEWHEADTLLAYTVLLHIPDESLPAMMEKVKQYPRVVIGEIMGRKWRTPGNPPVFNRERSEYEALLGPAKQVIRVPYPHYKTELELCVW